MMHANLVQYQPSFCLYTYIFDAPLFLVIHNILSNLSLDSTSNYLIQQPLQLIGIIYDTYQIAAILWDLNWSYEGCFDKILDFILSETIYN